MTSVGEFDKICVRSFLTLDASILAGNSEGDILYSMIYETVNVNVVEIIIFYKSLTTCLFLQVSCHNDLLDCIQTVSSQSKDTNMNRYIPGSIPSVLPSGVTENTCITGRSER